MKIENRMQLHLWREECKEKRQKETCRVLICGGQDDLGRRFRQDLCPY